jgi:tetratricopeptide (TPR) repeat protein
MSVHVDKAMLLLEQSRPDMAEQAARRALTDNPNNPLGHATLAVALGMQGKLREATRQAQAAVHLGPDIGYCHYVLAAVLCDRNRLKESERTIHEAIRVDPTEPDYLGLLAKVHLERRDWQGALKAADEGLELDAEHGECANARAMALTQLGRHKEAAETVEGALARDPEDPVTQMTQGWAMLHRQNAAKALQYFREALRLDPTLEGARAGIVEALKSRHIVYRLLLQYFLWMSTLGSRAQWAVIIGLYFGARIVIATCRANPDLAPFLYPLIAAYILFVFFTWTAQPLFNLLLRLNRFGRLALSRDDIVASNWVAGSILLAIVLMAAAVLSGHRVTGLAAFMAALLVIPLAATFSCTIGWPRIVMSVYTGVVVLAGLGLIVALAIIEIPEGAKKPPVVTLAGAVFVVGVLLSSWVGNALSMARVQR